MIVNHVSPSVVIGTPVFSFCKFFVEFAKRDFMCFYCKFCCNFEQNQNASGSGLPSKNALNKTSDLCG